MKNYLCLVGLLTLFACSDSETSSQATVGDTTQTNTETNSPSVDKPTTNPQSSKNPAVAHSAKWVYEKTVNADGQTVYKASVTSPTQLQFGFPHTGGSTVMLTVRQRADNETVYLQVANGEFNRSFQGGTVRIGFDNKPPMTYAYSAAENGSATIIFFDAADKIISQLKSAGKMNVDVTFHNQGNRQIEFRTANLTWNH